MNEATNRDVREMWEAKERGRLGKIMGLYGMLRGRVERNSVVVGQPYTSMLYTAGAEMSSTGNAESGYGYTVKDRIDKIRERAMSRLPDLNTMTLDEMKQALIDAHFQIEYLAEQYAQMGRLAATVHLGEKSGADEIADLMKLLPPGAIVECSDPHHVTKEEVEAALGKANRGRGL